MAQDELVAKLGAKLTPDAIANIQKFQRGLSDVIGKMNLVRIAALGLATGAALFVKSVTDETKALQTLSEKTGLSTTTLQEFEYAAKNAGVSVSAVQNDLINLNKTMSSPIPGQFNMNFAMLGIAVRDANGKLKDSATLLEDVGARLSKMSHQQQMQWAQKLGISDDTLVLLRKGKDGLEALRKEAHELGTILSPEAIKISDKFRVSVLKLNEVWRGFSSLLTISAMPAIQRVIDGITEFIKRNAEFVKTNAKSFIDGFVGALDRLWNAFKKLGDYFSPFTDAIKDLFGDFDQTEFWIQLITGALLGLMVVFAPLIAKLALIGGAFYLLSIAIEDVFGYFNGDNSFIGLFFDKFAEKFPGITKLLKTLKDLVVSIFEGVFKNGGEVVKSVLNEIIGIFDSFLTAIDSVAGPLADFINNFTTEFPLVSQLLKDVAGFIGGAFLGALNGLINGFKALMGIGALVFNKLLSVAKEFYGLLEKFLKWIGYGGSDESSGGGGAGGGNEKLSPEESANFWEQQKNELDPLKYSQNTMPANPQDTQNNALPQAMPSTTEKTAPSASTQVNDNRTITQVITTSDPKQAADLAAQRINDSTQINEPGLNGPTVS